ncbi:MAG: DUF1501 domain-containing protein [Myxococcota bacterium]
MTVPYQAAAELRSLLTRRALLRGAGSGVGAAAAASLLGGNGLRAADSLGGAAGHPHDGMLKVLHHAPRAKRVIYLFMSGAPSQIDLWDHKPKLQDLYDKDLPESVIQGQRFTTMTSGQKRFPIAPSIYKFARHGQAGTEVSELLPHTAGVVDRLAVIRSMHTDSINHDPGITFMTSGHEFPGRPSLGAWLSYGLGSGNRDLPTFVVMTASWTGRKDAQALYSRLWGSGFLPSRHQGVALRAQGDPVLYLGDPPGVGRAERRRMLDALAELNQQQHDAIGDPETLTRMAQYEMAFRMQRSVPDLVDLSGETEGVLDLYGPDAQKPGTFAASCLLARRMAEQGVRFVQIFHRGWDQHGNLTGDLPRQARDIDQPCAGLIRDLEQRGMLDDTLVVWASEFGRTTYCQGALSRTNYGRDHHPRAFTVWLAGGGVKGGVNLGRTDDFSYNIEEDPVHVHDLNATLLHLMGIDHERMTHRFQGRDHRLTDVHGSVIRPILA